MKGRRLSAEEMDARREIMLQTAFRLFTEKNIDSVTMAEIAEATGFTTRSLQRYFYSKENLVVAVSTWAWENYLSVNREGSPEKTGTAAETYEFMVDSFIGLYRDNVNILRFNQLFNVYVRSQKISSEQMQPFIAMIDAIPMITPSIVKKERSRWDQIPLRASLTFSPIHCLRVKGLPARRSARCPDYHSVKPISLHKSQISILRGSSRLP